LSEYAQVTRKLHSTVKRSPITSYDRCVAVQPSVLQPPSDSHDWLGLSSAPLPIGAAHDWAVRPDCGAVVLFSGTVRDHAQHRTDVTMLEYEAYDAYVVPKLQLIADEIRLRWPETGRVVMLHRVGELQLSDVAVVVAVSTPHRPEAFVAARFGIDALKAAVPIWKREHWSEGSDWGLAATDLDTDLSQLQRADS
jgi:molybdopterin synthase catalytic subunit